MTERKPCWPLWSPALASVVLSTVVGPSRVVADTSVGRNAEPGVLQRAHAVAQAFVVAPRRRVTW